MEAVHTVRVVRVHFRLPAGPGTHPVVHQHRADAGREPLRPRAVRGRFVLVGPVVHHHQDVQDVRRGRPGHAVVHVRRVLRRRVRVRAVLRARDQQQEPRANPPRSDQIVLTFVVDVMLSRHRVCFVSPSVVCIITVLSSTQTHGRESGKKNTVKIRKTTNERNHDRTYRYRLQL